MRLAAHVNDNLLYVYFTAYFLCLLGLKLCNIWPIVTEASR